MSTRQWWISKTPGLLPTVLVSPSTRHAPTSTAPALNWLAPKSSSMNSHAPSCARAAPTAPSSRALEMHLRLLTASLPCVAKLIVKNRPLTLSIRIEPRLRTRSPRCVRRATRLSRRKPPQTSATPMHRTLTLRRIRSFKRSRLITSRLRLTAMQQRLLWRQPVTRSTS